MLCVAVLQTNQPNGWLVSASLNKTSCKACLALNPLSHKLSLLAFILLRRRIQLVYELLGIQMCRELFIGVFFICLFPLWVQAGTVKGLCILPLSSPLSTSQRTVLFFSTSQALPGHWQQRKLARDRPRLCSVSWKPRQNPRGSRPTPIF